MKYSGLKFILFLFILSVFAFFQASTSNAQILYDISNLRNQKVDLVWSYDKVKIEEAWDFLKSKFINFNFVSIGVVDTGVETSHQEFTPNVNIDFDISIDSSFSLLNFLFNLPNGHGTQVAGIMGADNKSATTVLASNSPEMNGIISGATTNYKIIARFKGTKITTAAIDIFAVQEAFNNGARIINTSFGWTKCVPLKNIKGCLTNGEFNRLSDSLQDLRTVFSDALFIAGAGNDSVDIINFIPAGLPDPDALNNIISVSATNRIDERAVFSNFGSRTDIAAPGVDVYAPAINNQYDTNFSGTSASAPLVTGVAAILKSMFPNLTPAEIKDVLTKSADPIKTDKPLGSGCFDPNNNPQGYNGCRLNAHRAVAWLLPPTPVILNTPIAVPAP